jgi:hypothetical protein
MITGVKIIRWPEHTRHRRRVALTGPVWVVEPDAGSWLCWRLWRIYRVGKWEIRLKTNTTTRRV